MLNNSVRSRLKQASERIKPEVVWKPIPGSSQELALDSRADHTLYCGSRGPGKTATQLMRFRRRVGLGYGAFWRGIIFDREYKNLSDLVTQSKRFFSAFEDGAIFKQSPTEYKWVWPTGEELLLRHIKKETDYDQFHGHEYPFIGWNELTKHPSSTLYFKMMSCNRSSFIPELHTPKNQDGSYATDDGEPLPEIPLEVFSTTNPSGPGHGWVKRIFIAPAPYGIVVRREIPVFNPRTQDEEIVVRKQVTIFGSYRENIYLSPAYIAELESIEDENLRKAWLNGDWDIVAGGAFDDVWDSNKVIVPRFSIPSSWRVDRSLDWGSTHPFSVGWWAETNGEEVFITDEDGTRRSFCPPPGSLIQIAEWYGTKEIGTNMGLKLGSVDVAEGIREREIQLMREKWIARQPSIGPADNEIRSVRDKDVETIEDRMADKGVRWEESDKSPGSRRVGLQLCRDRLSAVKRDKEEPRIYFMRNCQASITLIPVLPRDELKPDDVDTDAEDHPWDMVRYRVLKASIRAATKIQVRIVH